MEGRLTELEVRYDYLQRQLEGLSEALYEQQRTLDRLAARLEGTERRVAALYALVDRGPGDEPPPHY